MTGQRIDENTYIDEMREQGKYFQPDHWTSYQFPTGQAREPVLGVRHTDAVAFCDWWTKRENEGWLYRLPAPKEAKETPLRIVNKHFLGYWVLENDTPWLVSASLASKNSRGVSSQEIEKIDKHFDDAYLHESETAKTMMAHMRRSEIFHYYERVMNTPLDFGADRIKGFNYAKVLEEEVYSYLYSIYDDRKKIGLLIDLITLRERIAGRSPAFEGICLVKEQIR